MSDKITNSDVIPIHSIEVPAGRYKINGEMVDLEITILINALIAQSDPDMVRTWRPIETCPKDGTWFLGLIEGIPYQCKAFYNGDVLNYRWKMHTNMSEGQILRITKDENGNEQRVQIKEANDPKYQPHTLAYKWGMNHIPTHWMPLPTPPKKG